MTEQYVNIDFCDSKYVCRVCLGTNAVRPMYTDEIKWYQNVISKTLSTPTDSKLNICVICGHLLKKYISFYRYCRYSQDVLDQCEDQDSKLDLAQINRPLHDFVQTQIKTINFDTEINLYIDVNNSFDSQNDVDVNPDDDGVVSDRDADDDMPLVMLSKTEEIKNNGVKKKRKKSKNDLIKVEDTEIKQENDGDVSPGAEVKRRKVVREGFSSRMVQETDEYLVIKLTREQVLEEMRERSASEKYQRALYKCSLCVQGFNFEDVLAAHMEKHTQKHGSFECSMCSQYCPSAVSLRGHIKSHTTRYKCKICGCVRRARQHLLEHHALAHAHSLAQTYSCHHCHFRTNLHPGNKGNICWSITHLLAQTYSCHHCHFRTNKRTVIQRHVRTHRQSERHACEQCGRLFRTVESLRVHTTRHDKSRSLRCSECGRGFLYPSLLATHKARVHLQTEYYCVECDVRFKSPDNLRLHFKKAKRHRDSSSYTYSCPQCSERFVSAASLGVHASTAHGQPKRFACAHCARHYSSRESLRAHTRRAHRGQAVEGAGDE